MKAKKATKKQQLVVPSKTEAVNHVSTPKPTVNEMAEAAYQIREKLRQDRLEHNKGVFKKIEDEIRLVLSKKTIEELCAIASISTSSDDEAANINICFPLPEDSKKRIENIKAELVNGTQWINHHEFTTAFKKKLKERKEVIAGLMKDQTFRHLVEVVVDDHRKENPNRCACQ